MRDLAETPVWPLDGTCGGAITRSSVCYLRERSDGPRYVDVRDSAARGEAAPLLCDPLTGLLAYDSFAQHLTMELAAWLPHGAHLAIGDVDGLKEYVTRSNTADPRLFGHLAGNHCMKVIGTIVRRWAARRVGEWRAMACGTFGGDEVIVAVVGGRPEDFVHGVTALAEDIRNEAPRPCSFACRSVKPRLEPPADSAAFYAEWVGAVDRALFEFKASRAVSGKVYSLDAWASP